MKRGVLEMTQVRSAEKRRRLIDASLRRLVARLAEERRDACRQAPARADLGSRWMKSTA